VLPKETPVESYHLNVGQCYSYWQLFVCARQMTFFSKLWKWIKKIPAAAAVVLVVGQRTWEHIHAILITLPLQHKNTCIITFTHREEPSQCAMSESQRTSALRCGRCTFHFSMILLSLLSTCPWSCFKPVTVCVYEQQPIGTATQPLARGALLNSCASLYPKTQLKTPKCTLNHIWRPFNIGNMQLR